MLVDLQALLALVLEVAALLDDTEETLEVGLWQQLGQLAFLLGLAQAELPPRLLADVDEVGVAGVTSRNGI